MSSLIRIMQTLPALRLDKPADHIAEIREFIDADLNSAKPAADAETAELLDRKWVKRLFAAYQHLEVDPGDPAALAELDLIQSQFENLCEAFLHGGSAAPDVVSRPAARDLSSRRTKTMEGDDLHLHSLDRSDAGLDRRPPDDGVSRAPIEQPDTKIDDLVTEAAMLKFTQARVNELERQLDGYRDATASLQFYRDRVRELDEKLDDSRRKLALLGVYEERMVKLDQLLDVARREALLVKVASARAEHLDERLAACGKALEVQLRENEGRKDLNRRLVRRRVEALVTRLKDQGSEAASTWICEKTDISPDELHERLLMISQAGMFDILWYEYMYGSEIPPGIEPLVHFVVTGSSKGFSPGPDFDAQWYLDDNPDVRDSGYEAFFHYMKHGKGEGRLTKPPRNW